jgi:hypothetical protein
LPDTQAGGSAGGLDVGDLLDDAAAELPLYQVGTGQFISFVAGLVGSIRPWIIG